MSLIIKCGMQSEAKLIRKWCPGAIVLTGRQTVEQMKSALPSYFKPTSIISVGLCGALSPALDVGDVVTSFRVNKSLKTYPDFAWTHRLIKSTYAKQHLSYSTPSFGTASTPKQKECLFDQTGAWFIDNETLVTAQFASKFNIPWTVLRVVSDSSTDTIPDAAQDALDNYGNTKIWSVLYSLSTNPGQLPDLIRTALNARQAMKSLGLALRMAGSRLQHPDFTR